MWGTHFSPPPVANHRSPVLGPLRRTTPWEPKRPRPPDGVGRPKIWGQHWSTRAASRPDSTRNPWVAWRFVGRGAVAVLDNGRDVSVHNPLYLAKQPPSALSGDCVRYPYEQIGLDKTLTFLVCKFRNSPLPKS